MAFNGSGVYNLVMDWVSDATAGIKIRADRHMTQDQDFANALSNTITRDGQSVVTANIPWNGKRLINVGDPVNDQDALTKLWAENNIVAGAHIADAPPAAAKVGNLWWDSDAGNLYVKYDDGTSTQWVQINVSAKPIPDQISSAVQDMWAGFKTGALFAVNDKADGTGANVFSVSDMGAINATSLGATGAISAGASLSATGTISGANLTASGTLYASGGTMYVNLAAGYYNFAWTSSFVWRIIAASGRCELITNNSQRCYWDYSNGAFVNNGPAYKPGGGPFLDSSDERIKNVLGDYEPGLDEVVQLRPVRYTFKGNDTSEAPRGARIAREADDDGPEYEDARDAPYPSSTHYDAAVSEQQFIGLIAQEVEAVFPGMVTPRAGWIDGVEVDDLRDLDTTPLIFALVNAVKTLEARLATLEGAS